MTTIKEELSVLGMEKFHFDNESEDLLVLVNPISAKWLEGYELKHQVQVFHCQGEAWYEIPGGYEQEWQELRKPYSNVSLNLLENAPSLKTDLSEEEYQKLNTQFYKLFKTDNFAYTSSSSYAAFWNNEHPNNPDARLLKHNDTVLRALSLSEQGELIAVYQDWDEDDTLYSISYQE